MADVGESGDCIADLALAIEAEGGGGGTGGRGLLLLLLLPAFLFSNMILLFSLNEPVDSSIL